MLAVYNFEITSKGYGTHELSVQAESFGEAKDSAEQMLTGSGSKIGGLMKVIDSRLLINQTHVVERHMQVDTTVTHQGAITEYKGKASPLKAEGVHALPAGK